MSRMTAGLATATLLAMAATPALASDPAPSRAPSSAEVRAAYDRMDALTRSVFWAEEQQIAPSDPVAGIRLAQALRELGRYDQAVEAAEATLAIQPDNIDALLELGRAHIARAQAFYGVAPLERARDLAPRDWRIWSLLGTAYEQVSRSEDARAAWNTALELSPENPAVLSNAAMAQMTRGDLTGAEALLRRAAARPEANLQVRLNLALTLGLQGKMDEAEQILRRAMPPEQAEQNLAWLRSRNAGDEATALPVNNRTWGSLGQS